MSHRADIVSATADGGGGDGAAEAGNHTHSSIVSFIFLSLTSSTLFEVNH